MIQNQEAEMLESQIQPYPHKTSPSFYLALTHSYMLSTHSFWKYSRYCLWQRKILEQRGGVKGLAQEAPPRRAEAGLEPTPPAFRATPKFKVILAGTWTVQSLEQSSGQLVLSYGVRHSRD